jgi:hypothetical protein
MKLFRFILAVAIAWFLITLAGVLWHEVIFEDWYNEWVFGIERTEMPIGYFLTTHLMRALVFVYVYFMLYNGGNPFIKGLKFGFLMGILTGVTVTSYYGDFLITSPGWVLLEFVFNIIRAILVGVSTAVIIGEGKPKPTP